MLSFQLFVSSTRLLSLRVSDQKTIRSEILKLTIGKLTNLNGYISRVSFIITEHTRRSEINIGRSDILLSTLRCTPLIITFYNNRELSVADYLAYNRSHCGTGMSVITEEVKSLTGVCRLYISPQNKSVSVVAAQTKNRMKTAGYSRKVKLQKI